MRNRIIDISVVAEIAKALKKFENEIIFVGGAVVSLYANDIPQNEVRPTGDIDLTVNIYTFLDWVKFEEEIRKIGFYPDPYGPSVCRHKFKDIPVDIIPIKGNHLGETNSWYKPGVDYLITEKVKDEFVRILSAPYFLATKFEAFNNRGQDPRTSHDIEDIFFILDQRENIVQEIQQADIKVKSFLKNEFYRLKNFGSLEELIIAHLYSDFIEKRLPVIIKKLEKIQN